MLLAGCGGGGGGSLLPATSGAGTGVATQSDFSGLSSAPLAVGDVRKFSPAETGYSGAYTATSSAPGVVSVSPSSGSGPFTATGVTAGTATITVADGSGHTSTVPLTVGSIGFGSLSSAPLAVGEHRAFTPSGPASSSGFTVTSSNPAVIGVSPGSGAGPFTLTGLAPGTSTITVANGSGGSSSMVLTVAAAGATPTSSPTTGPSGSPTSGPTTGPTTSPTSGPTTSPTSGPTTSPTSGPTTSPTSGPTTSPTSGPTTSPTSGPTTSPTSGPTSIPTTAPTSAPTTAPTTAPAPIGLSPAAITVGRYQIAALNITPNGGGTSFTTSVANGSIATIVQNGPNAFSVVGDNVGSTTITITDNLGHTATLPVTVSASPAPVIQLNPIGISPGGVAGIGANAVVLSPTESGYNGQFTAVSSNPTVAAVTPELLGKIAVATATQGSVIITVSDSNGNTASIGFTVQ